MQGMLMKPLGPDEIVEKTIRVMNEQGFDKVFLATEDAIVFEKYMNSEIADKTLYVDQERINYNDFSQTSFLRDIYKEMKRDLYFASVRYLGILNILSKCDGLISTTLCGAAKIAWGLNNGKYEYFDVPGIKNIQGDRD